MTLPPATAVAVMLLGAPGTSPMVIVPDVPAIPVPTAFVAATENVYIAPLVKPLIVVGLDVAVVFTPEAVMV